MSIAVKITQKTIKMKSDEYFKHILAYLARHFPTCTFSLSTKRYRGGKSLRISWTDGPEPEGLKGLQELYSGAEVGLARMKRRIDTIVTRPMKIEKMHVGFDFILLNRKTSA